MLPLPQRSPDEALGARHVDSVLTGSCEEPGGMIETIGWVCWQTQWVLTGHCH